MVKIVAEYYLAVDLGASSGRHILGHMENGQLVLEEIHRFKNGFSQKKGSPYQCWDIQGLFQEVLTGMKLCRKAGKIPVSMGIDTWGVDYVLLDKNGAMIGDSVAYRDSRTDGIDTLLEQRLSEEELYARTGIQKQIFNTIYQLLALRQAHPKQLDEAAHLLMIPEYLSYLLTGEIKNEYTNATTTGMVNAAARDWDDEVINLLRLPQGLLGPLHPPGTLVGELTPEVQAEVGYTCQVVFPCTHDTGSAVLSAPVDENSIYLSSGTWSLMGVELDQPICTEESRRLNLTNEGGYNYRYRYLKNIMGLWIIQSIKKEFSGKYSFDDLETLARQAEDFSGRIDVNEHRFLAPSSMIQAIEDACRDSGQPVPATDGELMSCVYQSLAESYRDAVAGLESITGKKYSTICIVGGGCQDTYLNSLTAKSCGKRVTAGPVEGTAIGNLLAQLIRTGAIADVAQARETVKQSFSIKEFS